MTEPNVSSLKINSLPEDDEMHLEELTHRLRNELEELDVEKVEVAKSGKAPEGTKSGADVPAWGSLLVTLVTWSYSFCHRYSSIMVKTR